MRPASEDQSSLAELRHRAFEAAKATNSKNATNARRVLYERSRAVHDYVLRRANGFCELTGEPAPFRTKSGEPYLEVHHIIRLADGGDDTVENALALCPNCHRYEHYA